MTLKSRLLPLLSSDENHITTSITWNPNEALTKLIQGSSIESSQGLSDLFILATIYLGAAFLIGALFLSLRSCWMTLWQLSLVK
jgi:hypothetical protein